MKIGNTSQTNVPVPNFYLTKNIKEMETFKVSEGKKYFREKDLFRNTKDLNFCNNPRNNTRKHECFNKAKYSPDVNELKDFMKTNTNLNTTGRKTFYSKDTNRKDNFSNYRNFLENTNIEQVINPNLKEEIKTNINVLLDKITHNYDLEKWANTDTRTNFINIRNFEINNNQNLATTIYDNNFDTMPMRTNFNFNITKYADKNLNQTDANKFKTNLRDKINGMTLERNLKDKLLSKIDLNNQNSPPDKYYKTKASNLINISPEDKKHYESFENSSDTTKYDDRMNTIQCSKTSYATVSKFNKKLNTNNEISINDTYNVTKICLPNVMSKYSAVTDNIHDNQMKVEKLRNDNRKIYERFRDTSLFKDFPSPDRKEFVTNYGEKIKQNVRKNRRKDKSLVDFSNYNATKHRNIFCENYDINKGLMTKFKSAKKTFV